VTYRDANLVFAQRADALRAEIDELAGEEKSLALLAEAQERETKEQRVVHEEGAPRGALGASLLRIPVFVSTFLTVGFFLIPLELYIGSYVHGHADETVVPLAMLAGPGALAAVIAWPYRKVGGLYAAAVLLGLALAVVVAAIIAAGRMGAL